MWFHSSGHYDKSREVLWLICLVYGPDVQEHIGGYWYTDPDETDAGRLEYVVGMTSMTQKT
jgi:hypothetical protein